MVKFTDLISKGENNQRYVKYVFWKVFKSSKIINESISCNAADVFYSKSTQKKIGHSKGTLTALQGHLGTRALKAFGHLGTRALKAFGHLGTRAFEALGHSKGTWELGHSKGTWAFGYSRHLGTWTLRQLDTRGLKGHLGTQVLRRSGARDFGGTLFSRLSKD